MLFSPNINFLRYNYKRNIFKCYGKCCNRCKSTSAANTKTYSHTIIFPKTKFPNRSSNAIRDEIQKVNFSLKTFFSYITSNIDSNMLIMLKPETCFQLELRIISDYLNVFLIILHIS